MITYIYIQVNFLSYPEARFSRSSLWYSRIKTMLLSQTIKTLLVTWSGAYLWLMLFYEASGDGGSAPPGPRSCFRYAWDLKTLVISWKASLRSEVTWRQNHDYQWLISLSLTWNEKERKAWILRTCCNVWNPLLITNVFFCYKEILCDLSYLAT